MKCSNYSLAGTLREDPFQVKDFVSGFNTEEALTFTLRLLGHTEARFT